MDKISDVEREAIILNAVRDMINEMVNHAIFMPLGDNRHDTHLMPTSPEALRQFGTLLRDFLSPVTSNTRGPLPFGLAKETNPNSAADRTTLFYLRLIGETPLLGTEIEPLKRTVQEFSDWLEGDAFVPKVWLPNINTELDLTIRRIDFIQISGDIGKHNFLRLGRRAQTIRKILADNGKTIDEDEAYLVIPHLWDWFHTHLFAYHACTIAEFLNNIRYAVIDYIGPVAQKAFVRLDGLAYRFELPDNITNKFATAQYIELLDCTRRKPYYPKFTVASCLKGRY